MQVTKSVAAHLFEQGRTVTIEALDGDIKDSVEWDKTDCDEGTLDSLLSEWYTFGESLSFHVQAPSINPSRTFVDHPKYEVYYYEWR